MKRHLQLLVASSVGLASLSNAAVAYAQDDAGDAAAGLFGSVCCGIISLALIAFFVFWVIMIIDLFQRQEWEFPGSNGSTKTTWLIIMLVSWLFSAGGIVAIVYYFMVYRKIKRGSVAPPAGYGTPGSSSGYAPPPPPPAGPSGYAPPPPPPAGPSGYAPPPPPPPPPPAAPAPEVQEPPAPEPPIQEPPAPEPPVQEPPAPTEPPAPEQ